jgi:DNA-binding Lrp family transcriptional regulator
LPLKIDETDLAILRILIKDARISSKEIAKKTGISAPTVRDHIRKMTDAGIILGYFPLLNTEKILRSTSALLQIHVELSEIDTFLERLTKLKEVRSVFRVTGEANVLVRVFLPESRELDDFVSKNIAGNSGVRIVSSQIITQTVKDEAGAILDQNFSVKINCDYCGREILTTDAIVINVMDGKRFVCCPSCEELYRAKYLTRRPIQGVFS